ncbi:MAG: TolC family protein, partial [Chitinophagaceae bacterium]
MYSFCLGLCSLLLGTHSAKAQDSLRILTEAQFLNAVRAYHPVAKQGTLLVDLARANLTEMRGAFDPVFFFNNDQKTFDGKNYFNYNQSGFVLPTWFGIELYGGLENNFGDLISSEVTPVPSSYAGASIPLLRDLVLDKRRASLQQAKLFRSQSNFDRRVIINDLLLDAYFSYWNWSKDYQVYQVIRNTVAINSDRYELVKIAFAQGDRAAIDTTEALAQLQSFQQLQEEAWLKFRKSSLDLSNFLWLANETPAYLSENIIPDTSWAAMKMQQNALTALDEWITNTLSNHPKLQSLDLKIDALEVERKLKFQTLLPRADLKYNFLQNGYEPWRGVNWNFMENNFKFGLNLSVPIPNRRGIGA